MKYRDTSISLNKFGSYFDRISYFLLSIMAFLMNFIIFSKPSVILNIMVVFYAISIGQSIIYMYVYNKYMYFFKVKEVLINKKSIVIKFRKGFFDCFTWDNVRYIDPFFQKIVFSGNSCIYLSGMNYLRDKQFITKLNKISDGKIQVCIRNKILGSRKLWILIVRIYFVLKYNKPIYLRNIFFRHRK